MTHTPNLTLAVFFTHGVSLELWEKRGMFSREVHFYEALAREVDEVWFFTYSRDDERFASRLDSRIRIFPKRLPLPDLLYAFFLPFLHWRKLKRTNAIRIHQMAGAIPALITHWLLRKPLLVRAGFQWYSFASRQGASHLKLWLISFIEMITYRSARAIIHTTQEDADFVAKRYQVTSSKLQVIPNYVDTDLFRPMGIARQSCTVCFVGRFEEQKNLLALVEAMQGIDAKLVLYGEGSQRKKLEGTAREYGVDIEFRGRIANEELPAALNACEVFVLPSLYEGNPKVLLEAMACGLPVVGTNVDGIRELIRDHENGVLAEPNRSALHDAIKTLLNDTWLQRRLGIAARQTILDQCSIAQVVQQETRLLHSL